VLIVDDDPGSGACCASSSKASGTRSVEPELPEWFAQAVESRPDVIILELDLPDGDGFAVLDALRNGTRRRC